MSPADARSLVPVDLGPDVRAAFTTVGTGNLGSGVGDDPARVRSVRGLVASWVGAPVAFGAQVHGAAVHVVAQLPDPRLDAVAEADGLVSGRHDVALGVVVADCVPVLLADPVARVVGTAHAGRRGVEAGVVGAVVEAMVAAGAVPGDTRAVVGPAACGACYEVPDALRSQVCEVVPQAWSTTSWGTPALDLPGAVRRQLADAGVRSVASVGGCTVEDARWFSHRAATGGSVPVAAPPGGRPVGRMAGVVRLLPG